MTSRIKLPTDERLWSGNSGLCTSFAIRVANQCQIRDIVEYGDNGSHRAAWQKAGQVAWVIDSSARQAVEFQDAYKLQDKTFNGKHWDGQFLKDTPPTRDIYMSNVRLVDDTMSHSLADALE